MGRPNCGLLVLVLLGALMSHSIYYTLNNSPNKQEYNEALAYNEQFNASRCYVMNMTITPIGEHLFCNHTFQVITNPMIGFIFYKELINEIIENKTINCWVNEKNKKAYIVSPLRYAVNPMDLVHMVIVMIILSSFAFSLIHISM